ncbi:MAG: hypothetical protein JWQ48_229 [Conexibacter sp.]|nr:hypothetical protein [Conexibacter sp.]
MIASLDRAHARSAGVLALAIAVAGLAPAAAASARKAPRATSKSSTVRACINKRSGALRIIGGRQRCTRSERSFSFNAKGLDGRNGSNGTSGASGRNGTNGANGVSGTNGRDGTTISLRARTSAPITGTALVGGLPTLDYPLTNGAWTQAATEVDVLFGELKYIYGSCTPAGTVPTAIAYLDGQPFAQFYALFASTPTLGSTVSANLYSYPLVFTPPSLFEPGAATPHTLALRVGDSCTTGHLSIQSAAIDVASYR